MTSRLDELAFTIWHALNPDTFDSWDELSPAAQDHYSKAAKACLEYLTTNPQIHN